MRDPAYGRALTSGWVVLCWFQDDSEQAQKYNEYGQLEHQATTSHELIGGAAAYEVRWSIDPLAVEWRTNRTWWG